MMDGAGVVIGTPVVVVTWKRYLILAPSLKSLTCISELSLMSYQSTRVNLEF